MVPLSLTQICSSQQHEKFGLRMFVSLATTFSPPHTPSSSSIPDSFLRATFASAVGSNNIWEYRSARQRWRKRQIWNMHNSIERHWCRKAYYDCTILYIAYREGYSRYNSIFQHFGNLFCFVDLPGSFGYERLWLLSWSMCGKFPHLGFFYKIFPQMGSF